MFHSQHFPTFPNISPTPNRFHVVSSCLQDDATDQMEMAFTLPFGQFDDLKDLPGLAHLTEHLLLSGPGPSDALQA